MENKLRVRNLTISFRTMNGKVQAVRGINFDLQEGETLAIVGESGSGKSVTSKAILGILAGNAIVEGGEIIYDGMDLMRVGEDEFHRIRGDKIAMIFQDPMSSLNPIVRIGKQLTEAMILKGKARQKESRITFNTCLHLLREHMIAALAEGDKEKADALVQKCKDFDKFAYKHLELEGAFNEAHQAAEEGVALIENLVFELRKHAAKDLPYRVKRIARLAKTSVHTYVVDADAAELLACASTLVADMKAAAAACKAEISRLEAERQQKLAEAQSKEDVQAIKVQYAALISAQKQLLKSGKLDYPVLCETLEKIGAIMAKALAFTTPNFFAMGYYLTFSGQALPEMSVEELNVYLRQYLDEHFMLDFISDAKHALIHSADVAEDGMRAAITLLREKQSLFSAEVLDKKAVWDAYKVLKAAVAASIDYLAIVKDSRAYTFAVTLRTEIEQYFSALVKNAKEEKRFATQDAKYQKLVAAGKQPDWKLVPMSLVDVEEIKNSMVYHMERLATHFEHVLERRASRDFDAETVAVIDHLKSSASSVVNRVTKAVAKEKAIKLMEEVGIPEPRRRYRQYPFEFSGGMRQRIVIAIALAANPDILICDEPTTALDVTIQAQILELINKLKRERNLSIIFITHDLGVVANMADRIAVMYAGKIVELGTADEVFYSPAHPYTWALLSSMPDLDTNEKLEAIPGTPPNMIYPPVGDAFAARNKYALQIDFEQEPPMFKITETHSAATWLLHEYAPHVEPPKIVTERIARMKKAMEEKNDAE